MPKKVRSVVVIPPKDKRVRYIRIRFGIIIFFFIVFLGGVAGFFLPFNALTLDVVEINQKRNLTNHNKKLLSKIRNMRETIFAIRHKIDTLAKVQKNIKDLVDIEEQVTVSGSSEKKSFNEIEVDDLLRYANSTQYFYREFVEKVNKNPVYFTYLPLIKPVSEECVITARFGKRRDPFTGDIKWHNGVDFSGARETPVIATASGTVSMVQSHNYWGRRIRIHHRFGFSTVYAHLGTVKVHEGKNVKKGDVIATIGISGLTIGPHLHYEIHYRDSSVNPEMYFFPDSISSVAYLTR